MDSVVVFGDVFNFMQTQRKTRYGGLNTSCGTKTNDTKSRFRFLFLPHFIPLGLNEFSKESAAILFF